MTAVRALVRSAYAPYVPRIGQGPAQMNADYERAIEDGTSMSYAAPASSSSS